MDNTSRWFAGLLVAFLGLVASPAFAQTATSGTNYDSQADALAACLVAFDAHVERTQQSGFMSVYRDIEFDYVCELSTIGGTTARPNTYILGYSGIRNSDDAEVYWGGNVGVSGAPYLYPVVSVYRFGGPVSNPCESVEEFESRTLRAPSPNGAGTVCYSGCVYTVSLWYHGTYPAGYLAFTFSPTTAQCEPGDYPEPTNVPIESEPDFDPNEPLDLDPDQGGVEPSPDPGKGRDADGRGSSSGGGSCDAPPSCTGDSIQCNILFQSWSTRCAVDNVNETLGGGDGGNGEGGEGAWDGKTQDPTDTDISRFISDEVIDGADFLDSSGMGLSRSCPQLENFSLNFFGSVIEIDFMPRFCAATSWLGPFMVLLGTYLGILAFLRAK